MERKTPRFRRRFESFAKKPSTALSQEQEVGTKWKVKRSWRPSQARTLASRLVGGVVVEDHMDALAAPGSHRPRWQLRKRMNSWWRWRCMQRPMTLPSSTLRAAEQGASCHAEACSRGSWCQDAPCFHRQAGLGAVERLDLRLFVDREHDGVGRRVDVEPDHIAQFGDEVGIVRKLELPHPMGPGSPCARQMRCTELTLMLVALAIMAATQWVASAGGSLSVRATTRSATSGPSGGMRDGRVLSRSRPS